LTLIFSPEVGSGEAFKLLFAFGHKPTLKRVPNPGLLLKIKMKKSKPTAGYRLHVKRLLFASNTGTTRTFKYPLVKTCKKHGKQKATNFLDIPHDLIEAIKHDDLYIRGPSNLVDYIKYKDAKIYTLIDFWLDSLRAGVVFMPSTASLVDFVTRLKNGTSIFKKVINDADIRIKKYFKPNKFIEEFITKTEIRINKSRQSFISTLTKILNDDIKEDEELLYDASRFITELANIFFEGEGKLKIIGKHNQNKKWKDLFNLDKELVDLSFDTTFYIFPELSFGQDIPITHENLLKIFDKLIEIRKNWLEKHNFNDSEIEKLLDKILGLSDNFNALSNYFNNVITTLKKENGIEQIINTMQNISEQDVNIIKDKILWLTNKLTKLDNPKIPGVANWSDYRSLVGGKLLSWWSNHKKRHTEQAKQIKILKESLKKITEFIEKYPTEKQEYDVHLNLAQKKNIYELINQIKYLTKDIAQIQANIKQYETLESLVNALRQQLNEYSQLYYTNKEGQKVKPSEISYLKDFWDLRIYKPRSFYGYAQREKLEKIARSTIPTIKSGINLVQGLLKQLQNLPDYANAEKETDKNSIRKSAGFRRLLEALARKIRDHKINTKPFRDKYLQILQNYANSYELKNLNKYVFFKSNYSTSTQHEIELKHINYADEAKSVVTNLIEFLSSYEQAELLNNPKLLLDWVETAKLVIARMFRWMDQQREWNLNDFNLQVFPTAKKFIESLSGPKINTPMLRYNHEPRIFRI